MEKADPIGLAYAQILVWGTCTLELAVLGRGDGPIGTILMVVLALATLEAIVRLVRLLAAERRMIGGTVRRRSS